MLPSGHGIPTTSWDLLTPQEGIRQFSRGQGQRHLGAVSLKVRSLHQQAAASPEFSGPAQGTKLMSLGAGCSVLTRSQVILLLASLRTTAVVESAQWDPGKEQLKTFQPLFCF